MSKKNSPVSKVNTTMIAVVVIVVMVFAVGWALIPSASGPSSDSSSPLVKITEFSGGVSSCTTLTDADTRTSSEYCSGSKQLLLGTKIGSLSSVALTSSGDNWTLYNSNTGASAPISENARITLTSKGSDPESITVNCGISVSVNGKIVATNSSSKAFTSLPNLSKVCDISRDGRILETQDFVGNGTYVVAFAFTGDFTAVFSNGKTFSRSFSSSLGNVTVKTSIPNTITTTTTSTSTTTSIFSNVTATPTPTIEYSAEVKASGIPLPPITTDSTQVGSTSGSVIVTDTVPIVSEPLIDVNTGTVSQSYVEKVETTILTSDVGTSTIPVTVGGTTLDVSVCQVGSCSYSPNSDGTATVTATVTKSDVAIYERDSQQILNQFEADSISDLTPYSRCAYFLQC